MCCDPGASCNNGVIRQCSQPRYPQCSLNQSTVLRPAPSPLASNASEELNSGLICQYGFHCDVDSDCVAGNMCRKLQSGVSQCVPDVSSIVLRTTSSCLSNWDAPCNMSSICCDPGAVCMQSSIVGFYQCMQPQSPFCKSLETVSTFSPTSSPSALVLSPIVVALDIQPTEAPPSLELSPSTAPLPAIVLEPTTIPTTVLEATMSSSSFPTRLGSTSNNNTAQSLLFESLIAIGNMSADGLITLDKNSSLSLLQAVDMALGLPTGCCTRLLSDSRFFQVQSDRSRTGATVIAHVYTKISMSLFPHFVGTSVALFYSLRENMLLSAASGKLEQLFRNRSRINQARETYFAVIEYGNVTSINFNVVTSAPTMPPAVLIDVKSDTKSGSSSTSSSKNSVYFSFVAVGAIFIAVVTFFAVKYHRNLKAKKEKGIIFTSVGSMRKKKSFFDTERPTVLDTWFDVGSVHPAILSDRSLGRKNSSWRDFGLGRSGDTADEIALENIQSRWNNRYKEKRSSGDSYSGVIDEFKDTIEDKDKHGNLEWTSAPRKQELCPWNEYGPLNGLLDKPESRYSSRADGRYAESSSKALKGQLDVSSSNSSFVTGGYSRKMFQELFATKVASARYRVDPRSSRSSDNSSVWSQSPRSTFSDLDAVNISSSNRFLQPNTGFFFQKNHTDALPQTFRDRRQLGSCSSDSSIDSEDYLNQILVDGKRTKVSRLLQLTHQETGRPTNSSANIKAVSLVGANAGIMSSQRNAQSFATVTADRTEHGMSDYSIMSDSENKHTGDLVQTFRYDSISMSADIEDISKLSQQSDSSKKSLNSSSYNFKFSSNDNVDIIVDCANLISKSVEDI